jgi:acyl carrier protein
VENTNTEILDKVRDVMANALGISVDKIAPSLAFGELDEWDSMGHMEVMVSLEEHFGVEINAETISEFLSIPIILAHIEGQANDS